jgi:hypothetical protein
MKTTTKTPAQAEHQLTHVADHFDHWRRTRTTPAEPIPHSLWEQAIALTTMFSIRRVATRLQGSGEELQQRCAAYHTALAAPPSPDAPAFVEVPAAPACPLPTSAIEIELYRSDGARLRIAAYEAQLPLTALVRTFLEMPV